MSTSDDSAHPPGPEPRRDRVPSWVFDLLAVSIIIAGVFVSFPAERPVDTPFALVLAALPVFFIPLRRRWPVQILVACLVVFVTASFFSTLTPGIIIATAIAMFGVATRRPRRVTLVASAAAVGVIIVVTLAAVIGRPFDPYIFQLSVFIAFSAVLGDAVRSRREYIRAITDRAIRAESARESEALRRVAEERLRIARDLHDTVAHQISVISLNAGVAAASMDARPEKAKAALGSIRIASRTVLTEIGDLLEMLRTPGEMVSGVHSFPQPGLARLEEMVARFREFGLEVDSATAGDVTRLSPAADTVAFRIVQEALTNAHKHGSGNRASIRIDARERALVIVATNPVPPATPHPSPSLEAPVGGRGLIGLNERVASVRGSITCTKTVDEFCLTATLPLVGVPA